MKPFRYESPQDAAAAVAMLSSDRAGRFLGGGTNLFDLMRLEVETPDLLVDVTRLGLDRIDETAGGGLLIGAGVRNSDLSADPRVRERYPMLAQALVSGASGQLRNLATVGGNLLQRTRCRYFQDVSKPCNKRQPGSGCPAKTGYHRNLAILGWSEECVATFPSDMAVALTALGASVHVYGRDPIPMPGLHRLPGDEPQRDTTLEPGELITAVELPPVSFAANSTYRKVRDRASFAFAVCSVAVAVALDDATITDVRIAYGGLAHIPWRAERAEAALVGKPATRDHFVAAADAELAQAQPLRDNGYKVTLARNVLVRALTELTA
jgi:xanthine dehydrogenase YagS FAD-binding subunit